MPAMDRAGLIDLFDFTTFAWEEIRHAVPGDEDLLRIARGSGWPTLRHCLAHMVLAYDRWLPAITSDAARPVPELRDGDLLTWRELDAGHAQRQEELRGRLRAWSDAELFHPRDVNVDGGVLRYSRAELVLHLLLHERGHHGDVTTLFWQLGIEPDRPIEYRFYLGRA